MATIGETMDVHRKRLRIALVVSIVAVLAVTTLINQRALGASSPWWILVAMLPSMGVVWWIGRKLVCPRCRRGLSYLTMANLPGPIHRCPFCAADFDRPMPRT